MKKFTIRYKGVILGTYSGANEAAALDAACTESYKLDFEDFCEREKVSRNDFHVEVVA